MKKSDFDKEWDKTNRMIDAVWKAAWIAMAVAAVVALATAVGGVTVAWHFLAKWW